MTTKSAPTTSEQWLERTSLLLDVQVDSVLAERPEARRRLTPNQIDWFYNHVDQRFRYLHALDPKWRKWTEDRNRQIDPRLQARVWIRHWLDAYLLDPERYQQRCPLESEQ